MKQYASVERIADDGVGFRGLYRDRFVSLGDLNGKI